MNNMTEALYDMVRNGVKHENAIDIYWTKLMPMGKWYAIYPALGYQYANYSDIQKQFTYYGC